MTDATAIVAPVEGPDDRWFWDGVRQHELRIHECASCHRLQHPPTPLCPACGSDGWTWRVAIGRGRVYSWIVSRHPSTADGPARIVALIELEEGTRLVSNLIDVEAADVDNGMLVEVAFAAFAGGVVLPQFRPVERGPARP